MENKKDRDWAETHGYYNQIINLITRERDPALMKKLDRITKKYHLSWGEYEVSA